ncbi:MAG: ATP-binding cassette domain-containing protein [Salibacteraceae bacterium]
MNNILEAHGISKTFGSFEALKNVSISIPEGKIFGLLGPNGAGKTTLIRILTQITGPDQGAVLFKGKSLPSNYSQQFGYLPEERGLYRKMKVWEQALYLTQIKGLSKAQATAALGEWFKRLNMTTWLDKNVESLSKGMQQKLQFVITVAPNPSILILDEPFSGFDPVNSEELKKHILELRDQGSTIIFSTHNMASVEELCENIALINQGEKVLDGGVDEIRTSFSKSLFKVHFKGSKVAFANALGFQYEIISLKEKESISKAIIKGHEDLNNNALIKRLTDNLEIIGFQEMIPSMNDIFIDLVSAETNNTHADVSE